MGDFMRTRCQQLLCSCACSGSGENAEHAEGVSRTSALSPRYGSPTRGYYSGLQSESTASEAEYGGSKAGSMEPRGAMVYGSNGLGQYTPRTAYLHPSGRAAWSPCGACLTCFIAAAGALALLVMLFEQNSHTSALYYDCSTGFARWQTAWPRAKQEWCCRRERRGCTGARHWWSKLALPYVAAPGRSVLERPEQQAAVAEPLWASPPARLAVALPRSAGAASQPTAQPAPLAQPARWPAVARPAGGFHCSVDAETWRRSWSVFKKAWCCQHNRSGCPPALPSASTAPPQASDFICDRHASDWELGGWSRAKRVWCCDRHSIGCRGAAPLPC